MEKSYIAIDLKSFFASCECVERGLDALTTNLVVADEEKTEKTICLAVSPSLKSYGISGRARLFEVIQQVKKVNQQRKLNSSHGVLVGKSVDFIELNQNKDLAVDYIVASPRMALYSAYSQKIYDIYLKYFSPSEILCYSIDEVILDATPYLKARKVSARKYAELIIAEILKETGITATVGIGTNMYLAKVAMDVMAKKIPADEQGVRIAELNERSYREELWGHRPLTDFWRIGKATAKKLEENGIYTMGDIARCSIGQPYEFYNEGLLYKLFGVNAELIIDHAWGWEPCSIKDAKSYKPKNNSLCSGQVLLHPYDFEQTRLIVKEMTDLLVLDLVDKGLLTNQIVLTIGYDIENLTNDSNYKGEIIVDFYGRKIPKYAHGTVNFDNYNSSTKTITQGVLNLFDNIVDKTLLARRLSISANKLISESDFLLQNNSRQISFFEENSNFDDVKEKNIQKTVINIKKKYGKNAILKGINFEEGATTKERNKQMGGHKA